MEVCQICEGLQESIDYLIEENKRLKNRNRILMAMKTQLRRKLEETMKHADDVFLHLTETAPESISQADGYAEPEQLELQFPE